MNTFDWTIITLYLLGLIVTSFYLSRGQNNTEEYFLGGRSIPWLAIGVSTMATQLGAVSFISAPAFVALRKGGGLVWLGYEFAVPIAMIFVMIFILPFLHRTHVVSIYEYLELRFDAGTRTLVSLIFQISRALATGVTVYAVALVLSVTVGIELWLTIVMIGLIAMIYDTLGGIKAVIFTDVIQMAVLLIGIVVCGGFALYHLGGWQEAVQHIPVERLKTVDWHGHGLGDGKTFGFWPLVCGGFFLYVAYYGCDQSQVQRELSAGSEDDVKRSLFFNGVFRFPIVLGYCTMGLLIGALLLKDPSFAAAVPEESPDCLVPIFMMRYLPNGVIGLLVVAIFAAAMSSLDSALNSLSAVSYHDLYLRYFNPAPSLRESLMAAKMLTVFWGIVCTGFAFLAGTLGGTVIETINRIGSTFYGPIAATFTLGILTRATTNTSVKIGILSGVLTNLVLWTFIPQISWLWWNPIGFGMTFGIAYSLSLLQSMATDQHQLTVDLPHSPSQVNWKPRYVFLGFYFVLIILISYGISFLAT